MGAELSPTAVQRRTLRLLFSTQLVGGVGMAIGVSVGVLLAAELAGVGKSGLAPSVAVVGAALLAIPVTRIIQRYGRRPGLVTAYLAAALGAAAVVTAAATAWAPLLFAGFFLLGGATTANLQVRHAATDLAPPARRGRHLAVVLWAATAGTVAGPNLAPLASTGLARAGMPPLAGPFVLSGMLFGLAAAALAGLLRPDPLLVARDLRGRTGPGAGRAPNTGLRAALGTIASRPDVRLGTAAPAVAFAVMTALMLMTPVHIRGAGEGDVHTLRVVGIVLSVHIAGMYALAPVLGALADRYGRRPVIVGGVGLLMIACVVAGSAGHHPVRLTVGLFLLGVGWSALLVASSALLSEAVPEPLRTSVQGLADLVMLLSAAAAGAASGPVVEWLGYPALTLLAAVLTVPLAALALRPGDGTLGGEEGGGGDLREKLHQ